MADNERFPFPHERLDAWHVARQARQLALQFTASLPCLLASSSGIGAKRECILPGKITGSGVCDGPAHRGGGRGGGRGRLFLAHPGEILAPTL